MSCWQPGPWSQEQGAGAVLHTARGDPCSSLPDMCTKATEEWWRCLLEFMCLESCSCLCLQNSLSFSQPDLDNCLETYGTPVRFSHFTLRVHSHTTTTFCPQKLGGSQEVTPAFHQAASSLHMNIWWVITDYLTDSRATRETKILVLNPNKPVQRPQVMELEIEMGEAKYTEWRQRTLV